MMAQAKQGIVIVMRGWCYGDFLESSGSSTYGWILNECSHGFKAVSK